MAKGCQSTLPRKRLGPNEKLPLGKSIQGKNPASHARPAQAKAKVRLPGLQIFWLGEKVSQSSCVPSPIFLKSRGVGPSGQGSYPAARRKPFSLGGFPHPLRNGKGRSGFRQGGDDDQKASERNLVHRQGLEERGRRGASPLQASGKGEGSWQNQGFLH